MNCEHCKEFISAFLDNELDETSSEEVQMHLAICTDCAKMCEDFAMILDFCEGEEAENILPNSDALWCRINNIVETEIEPEVRPESTEEVNQGWLSNNWQLSFSQVLVSILGIAIISSLITIIGIQNFSAPKDDMAGETTVSETIFTKVLGKFGLIETPEQARDRRLQERQKAIDYWTQRVAERRSQWDDRLRETFDRNLKEIDQVVFEYRKIIKENPQDKLSGEILDSAMNEKMELLREFSEL
jgi:negative regulator of sigma E activity